MQENESKIASGQPSKATPCGSSSAIGCSPSKSPVAHKLTVAQWKLIEKHGTVSDFEKAIWKAHDDLFITTVEAMAAINGYRHEFIAAGIPSENPTVLRSPRLGGDKQGPVVGRPNDLSEKK